jgi:geranylgeranyl transferase type-2 subunit beta
MPVASYLLNLTNRLHVGLRHLPAAVRAGHTAYLRAAQKPDGGFPDREGGSDLYYTGFALRGLALLDALTPDLLERVAGFLRERMRQSASVVDFFSLLYGCLLVHLAGGPDLFAASPADWTDRVAAVLESFRTSDGGYGKTIGATSASTYHTFLVGLCYELLGRTYPDRDEVRRFVAQRRRDDGGYVEVAPMRRSGTNPTAAAVGALQLASGSGFGVEKVPGVASFLAAMTSPEGGLRANDRAPLADLLSTFTGCWTLEQLGALDRVDGGKVLSYVQGLEAPTGGFHGGLWDEGTDVEYTFYGLGALALFVHLQKPG